MLNVCIRYLSVCWQSFKSLILIHVFANSGIQSSPVRGQILTNEVFYLLTYILFVHTTFCLAFYVLVRTVDFNNLSVQGYKFEVFLVPQ